MLKILWQHGKLTVREIWKMYLEKQPDLGYTAVLTLLQYMEKKGMVAHETAGKAYRYYALRKENETITDMVRRFVDSVFDGATEAYVMHALENEALPVDKLDQLVHKKILAFQRDDVRFLSRPLVSQEPTQTHAMREVVDSFFGGSVFSAIVSLLDLSDKKMTDDDYERLARLIREAKKEDC